MRRAIPFLVFLPLALVTGCDPIFGVSRRAHVPFMPEPAMVGAAIQAVPGVDDVQYRLSEGGRPLTLTGIKSPDQIHTFSYHGGSNVRGFVQFTVDYKQAVEYSQYLLKMGGPPPQALIDATHPVMIEIENRLEKTCGLTNLQSSVVERCIRVKYK